LVIGLHLFPDRIVRDLPLIHTTIRLRGGIPAVIVLRIHHQHRPDLAQVAVAGRLPCLVPRLSEHREQYRGQYGNDSNHDELPDQGETAVSFHARLLCSLDLSFRSSLFSLSLGPSSLALISSPSPNGARGGTVTGSPFWLPLAQLWERGSGGEGLRAEN